MTARSSSSFIMLLPAVLLSLSAALLSGCGDDAVDWKGKASSTVRVDFEDDSMDMEIVNEVKNTEIRIFEAIPAVDKAYVRWRKTLDNLHKAREKYREAMETGFGIEEAEAAVSSFMEEPDAAWDELVRLLGNRPVASARTDAGGSFCIKDVPRRKIYVYTVEPFRTMQTNRNWLFPLELDENTPSPFLRDITEADPARLVAIPFGE
ncbi:MAG: hypothetical protein JW909_01485 [Planctomycetes bacterium]|nr:hypothetical protein [Planctomycetota bacterium]